MSVEQMAKSKRQPDDLRPEYDVTKLGPGVRGNLLVRYVLRGPDRNIALDQIASLTTEENLALFPEWIHLARAAHSPFQVAWDVIESLPRDWVLQNVEKPVDAILQNDEETDYWMFLQL